MLSLNAAISQDNQVLLAKLPLSIRSLSIEDIHSISDTVMVNFVVMILESSLTYLRITFRAAAERMYMNFLNITAFQYRDLRHLHISTEVFLMADFSMGSSFSRLDLDSLGTDYDSSERTSLLEQVRGRVTGNEMPQLRELGIARSLRWTVAPGDCAMVQEIDEHLKKRQEDSGQEPGPKRNAGVILFGS